MEKHKIQLTMSDVVFEKLNDLCRKKGFSKSILIAIAIEKYYQEEKGESSEDK